MIYIVLVLDLLLVCGLLCWCCVLVVSCAQMPPEESHLFTLFSPLSVWLSFDPPTGSASVDCNAEKCTLCTLEPMLPFNLLSLHRIFRITSPAPFKYSPVFTDTLFPDASTQWYCIRCVIMSLTHMLSEWSEWVANETCDSSTLTNE